MSCNKTSNAYESNSCTESPVNTVTVMEGDDNMQVHSVTTKMRCEAANTSVPGERSCCLEHQGEMMLEVQKGNIPTLLYNRWILTPRLGEHKEHRDGLKPFFFSILFCAQHTGNYNTACPRLYWEVNGTPHFSDKEQGRSGLQMV